MVGLEAFGVRGLEFGVRVQASSLLSVPDVKHRHRRLERCICGYHSQVTNHMAFRVNWESGSSSRITWRVFCS